MNTSLASRRSDPRVKARLRVKFKNNGSFINLYTDNISQGGVFIRTTKVCHSRNKVRMRLIIPKQESEIVATGKVVRVVTPDRATEKMPAGIGIKISLKKEDREKIAGFIKSKLKKELDRLGQGEHFRVENCIRLNFRSKQRLIEEYNSNISRGGIFIAAARPRRIREQIAVILIHPETEQEFLLHGEVMRIVTKKEAQRLNSRPGLEIRLHAMSSFARNQLDEFMGGAPREVAGTALIVEEY